MRAAPHGYVCHGAVGPAKEALYDGPLRRGGVRQHKVFRTRVGQRVEVRTVVSEDRLQPRLGAEKLTDFQQCEAKESQYMQPSSGGLGGGVALVALWNPGTGE